MWMSLAQGDRFLNDEVDELDDGGVALVAAAGQVAGPLRFGEVDGGVRELGQHGVHRLGFGLSVVSVDGLDDLLARCQDGLYIFVQDELKFLHGVEVAGVAHDDLERAVFLGQRQDDVFASDRFRDQLDDGGGDGDLGEIDELHPVKLGQGAHDLIGTGVAEFDEGVSQLGAGLLGDGAGFVELVGAEHLAAQKDVGEIAARLGHDDGPPG